MAGQILVGDVREQLRALSGESVHCVVTSPPYWSLRSYSTNPQTWGGDELCDHDFEAEPTAEGYTGKRKWQHTGEITRSTEPENWSQVTRGDTCRHCGAWRGELGGEPTPELYAAHIVEVFREVRRVLRRDGTAWVNLGDSYAAGKSGRDDMDRRRLIDARSGRRPNGANHQLSAAGPVQQRSAPPGLKQKDLVGIPWRVAFALQADGWYLRSDIIWSKNNPMPESATDRPTKSHEYLFLLSKGPKYYYDADAVREVHIGTPQRRNVAESESGVRRWHPGDGGMEQYNPLGRNRRSVWEIPTQPTPEAHFATYPEKLVEPCILAGTSERGVCRECGAPWRRVVEKTLVESGKSAKRGAVRDSNDRRDTWGDVHGSWKVETTGWINSCKHLTVPIPATVLDPFLGSGTTGRVAERLGRNWVGIELSESYAAIARRRTAQRGLMQWGAAAGGAE